MLLTKFRDSLPQGKSKGQRCTKDLPKTSLVANYNFLAQESEKLSCKNPSASSCEKQQQQGTSFDEQRWRSIFPFLQDDSTPFVALEKRPSLATLSTCPSDISLSTIGESQPQSILRTKPNSSTSTYGDRRIRCYNSVSFNKETITKIYKQSDFEKRGNNWYSSSDLWQMKMEAMFQRTHSISDDDEGDAASPIKEEDSLCNHEQLISTIKNILVVDSHPIFLLLFLKSFKKLLPHVNVTIARSGEEAWSIIQKTKGALLKNNDCDRPSHGFDIIVTEERLTVTPGNQSRPKNKNAITGSVLLKQISLEQKKMMEISSNLTSNDVNAVPSLTRYSLLIGVSANLDADRKILEKSGADIIWSKPPPSMNESLKALLLQTLLNKRNHVTLK